MHSSPMPAVSWITPSFLPRRRTTVLVSVHTLSDQKPAAGYQAPIEGVQIWMLNGPVVSHLTEVEVWEIPSTQWIGGRTVQPPAKRSRKSRDTVVGNERVIRSFAQKKELRSSFFCVAPQD